LKGRRGSGCLKDSPQSLYRHTLFCSSFEDWMKHYEEFCARAGRSDMHGTMTEELVWLSIRARCASGHLPAHEVRLTGNPFRRRRDMLDIGGSHGFYSVSMCRGRRAQSTVLDLPEAVRQAAPLWLEKAWATGWLHGPGDTLSADLGSEQYDFIFIGNCLHHFGTAANHGPGAKDCPTRSGRAACTPCSAGPAATVAGSVGR
jgi:2-polyprenyl-3-methyl-5-hydroxy-6-metoxy-1,4-benzoquinol methylase